MRILPTPFAALADLPQPHAGGFDPALLTAILPGPGQEQFRAKLAEPGALVVTTGQQPALFTGPLYAVYKALSAAALAGALEARWGRPVVPLFWVAGDDHDFAEANRASWLRPDGTLHVETLPDRPAEAALRPMYREPLGPGVEAALRSLSRDLEPWAEGAEEPLAWLGRHFTPGATMAAASGGALAELLAPLGVLCIDGASAALKAAAAPVIRAALEKADAVEDALVRRARGLVDAGRDAGVLVGDGATLVMLEGPQGRDRLVRDGAGFVTRHGAERHSLHELLQLLEAAPERFSGNVLLRPVVERAVLPTVAYVAGPGELRYLALAEAVYGRLDLPRQMPVPRWSGLLVEPRVDRALDKFGATLEELSAPGQRLEARVAREQMPAGAGQALASLRAEIARHYEALKASSGEIDPNLVRPLAGLEGRALHGVDKAEQKLIQHLKRRYDTDTAQIQRARTAVLPGGHAQERVLTVAPMLARYGTGILRQLLGDMAAWYASALERATPPS